MVALHDPCWNFVFSHQMICKQYIVLNHMFFWYESNLKPVTLQTFDINCGNFVLIVKNFQCSFTSSNVVVGVWQYPISLICMSAHKESVGRWLSKPPSHIWVTCHLGIATVPLRRLAIGVLLTWSTTSYQTTYKVSERSHRPIHLRVV